MSEDQYKIRRGGPTMLDSVLRSMTDDELLREIVHQWNYSEAESAACGEESYGYLISSGYVDNVAELVGEYNRRNQLGYHHPHFSQGAKQCESH